MIFDIVSSTEIRIITASRLPWKCEQIKFVDVGYGPLNRGTEIFCRIKYKAVCQWVIIPLSFIQNASCVDVGK